MSEQQRVRNLPPIPLRLVGRPVDHRGYPVPWFVEWFGGKPDFRVVDKSKLLLAVKNGLCWVCGERTGKHISFVIGPMCAVNRVSGEPPCHHECAVFAATACPFLAIPTAKRRESNKPEGVEWHSGGIARNPGVACVWGTTSYTAFPSQRTLLFDIGEPTQVLWFTEGRLSTREEVLASIESGLPLLEKEARAEGIEALQALQAMRDAALALVPL